MRVLALDYGSARCGCAVSDPTGTIATPIEPVLRPATRKGFGAIVSLVSRLQAQCVVVGLPLSLDGGDSAQTRETRAFAERLTERIAPAVAVELYDERFTTRLAQRVRDARSAEDSRAAAFLLESWLAARAGPPADDGSISENV